MATSSLGSASCKPSGIGRSHEPDERSPLINPDGRDDVSWSPTYPRRLQAVQHESRPVDEEARIGASESSKIDAIPKSTANIAGVISVLLLGMCVQIMCYHRASFLYLGVSIQFGGGTVAGSSQIYYLRVLISKTSPMVYGQTLSFTKILVSV